jgi:hypothetical protein
MLETLNLWKTHSITSSTDFCFGKIVLQYNRTDISITWNTSFKPKFNHLLF